MGQSVFVSSIMSGSDWSLRVGPLLRTKTPQKLVTDYASPSVQRLLSRLANSTPDSHPTTVDFHESSDLEKRDRTREEHIRKDDHLYTQLAGMHFHGSLRLYERQKTSLEVAIVGYTLQTVYGVLPLERPHNRGRLSDE